jgi:hypothetical protein
MRQILAVTGLDRFEGNFGDAFSGLSEGLNNISNALGGSGSNVASGSKNFQSIVELIISSILNPVVALLIGLAVVYFMWGALKYVNRGHDDGAEGVKMMTYGIFALFVMVSVWGLVYILINTFNLSSSSVPTPPALQ